MRGVYRLILGGGSGRLVSGGHSMQFFDEMVSTR